MAHDVEIVLKASASGFASEINRAATAVENLDKAATRSSTSMAKSSRAMSSDATRSARDITKSGMSAADGYDKMASAAAKGGAVVVAVGASMVNSYANFEQAMANVGASTGASAADLSLLGNAAKQAGQQFGQFTSTEAAGAIEELGKAGLGTADILSGGLHGAMALAAADGMEVGEAAELTANGLNQFGLKGGQAAHVADLLTQAAGSAAGNAHDLGMGLSQVGAVANSMGMSIEDTSTSLALFASNGVKGSDAGTSLKTMLMSLAKPSVEAAAQMKEMGVNAFDASGKFVGMRNLSDQLATATKGMSVEQKNAALATIFGADAMRVASIAAKEGAAGYDEQTGKMAAFGTAQEQAAKRSDTLKGRVAELGGAWENLGISLGSAASGPLKSVTEHLTSMLELAGRHPEAAQKVAMVAAALAGLGLAGAALVKGVAAAKAFHAALTAIGALNSLSNAVGFMKVLAAGAKELGAVGSLRALGQSLAGMAPMLAAIGPAAAIAAAGFAAIKIAQHFNSKNTAAIDQTRMSVEQISHALDGLNASAVATNAIAGLGPNIHDLGDAMVYASANTDGAAAAVSRWAYSSVGMKSEAMSSAEAIGRLDEAFAKLPPGSTRSAEALSALHSAFQNSGLSAQDFLATIPRTAEALQSQAVALTGTKLSAEQLVGAMSGVLPDSLRKAAEAASAAGGPHKQIADQLLATGDAAKQAANDLQTLGQLQLAMSGGMIGLEASIAQANKALKENGKGLDLTTEKGRQNQAALDQVAGAWHKASDSMTAAGAPASQMAAAQDRAYSSFVKTAQGMGKTSAEAKALAESYGLLPAEKTTTVKAQGAQQSVADVKAFMASVAGLPPEKYTTVKAIAETSGVDAAKAMIDLIPDSKTTNLMVQSSTPEALAKFAADIKALPADKQVLLNAIAKTQGVDRAKEVLDKVKDKSVTLTALGKAESAKKARQVTDGAKSKDTLLVGRGVATQAKSARAVTDGAKGKSTMLTGNGNASQAKSARSVTDGAKSKSTTLTANGQDNGARSIRALVDGARSKTISLITKVSKIFSADGNILPSYSAYADGGLENHQAQIAPGGAWRVWAEPETGGEAYIPLAMSKRPRSLALLEQVAAMFGRQVIPNATGNIYTPTPSINRGTDYGALVAALNALTGVTRLSAGAAQAQVREARAAKTRLAGQHKVEDADLRARIATATPKGKAALRKEVAQLDARQAREMAAATERVTAATAAAAAAQGKAKASTDAYKARQDAAAEAMRKVADNARAVSDSMSGRYGIGWDAADSGAIMREGAAEIGQLTAQIQQLRKLGLSESVVQQIADKGPGQGSEVAASILSGGKQQVAALNASAKALQQASDRLGKTVAIGKADGGRLYGPGTDTSDSIPLMGSRDEYMIRARSARSVGYAFLDYINEHGRLPAGYADGGRLGRPAPTPYWGQGAVRIQPAAPSLNFAPQVRVSGVDPDRVSREVAATLRHEYRSMAVQLPGA